MIFRVVYKPGQIFLPFYHNTLVEAVCQRAGGQMTWGRHLIAYVPTRHAVRQRQPGSATNLSQMMGDVRVPQYDKLNTLRSSQNGLFVYTGRAIKTVGRIRVSYNTPAFI